MVSWDLVSDTLGVAGDENPDCGDFLDSGMQNLTVNLLAHQRGGSYVCWDPGAAGPKFFQQ